MGLGPEIRILVGSGWELIPHPHNTVPQSPSPSPHRQGGCVWGWGGGWVGGGFVWFHFTSLTCWAYITLPFSHSANWFVQLNQADILIVSSKMGQVFKFGVFSPNMVFIDSESYSLTIPRQGQGQSHSSPRAGVENTLFVQRWLRFLPSFLSCSSSGSIKGLGGWDLCRR